MDGIINFNNDEHSMENKQENQNGLIEISEAMLAQLREGDERKQVKAIPIASLAGLGTCVSEMIPVFRTVTTSSTVDMGGALVNKKWTVPFIFSDFLILFLRQLIMVWWTRHTKL